MAYPKIRVPATSTGRKDADLPSLNRNTTRVTSDAAYAMPTVGAWPFPGEQTNMLTCWSPNSGFRTTPEQVPPPPLSV